MDLFHRLLPWLAAALLACLHPPAARALEPGKALTRYQHDAWLPEHGLPQVSVQDLLQCSSGYLWIATQEGVARFDGVRFRVYDKRSEPLMSVNSADVLQEDVGGGVWVGTRGGGLVLLAGPAPRHIGTRDGLPSDVIAALARQGSTLWVGTDRGLARVEGDSVEVVPGAELSVRALLVDGEQVWVGTQAGVFRVVDGLLEQVDGLMGYEVHDLLRDPDGVLWVATDEEGLLRWESGAVRRHGLEDAPGGWTALTLARDQDGSLWVGSNSHGLLRLRGEGFEVYGTGQGLTYDRVSALLEDREGSLWVGTFGGGLNRLRDALFVPLSSRDGLSHDDVWTILEDSQGRLWIGTEVGLNLYQDGVFLDYPWHGHLAQETVMSAAEDSQGRLWFGTYGDGLWSFDGQSWTRWSTAEGLRSGKVFDLLEDGEGALWVATDAGLHRLVDGRLEAFTTAEGLPHDNVRSLLLDQEGLLWVGTRGGGLATWEGSGFSRVDPGLGESSALDMVHALAQDEEGTLWVSTSGGLLRKGAKGWSLLTTEQGLLSDSLHELLPDGRGRLWVSSNLGVSSMELDGLEAVAEGRDQEVRTRVYGRDDGMLSAECNGGSHPSVIQTSDGRLWFSTIAGAVSVDPEEARTEQPPPQVILESVHVDNEPVDFTIPGDFTAGTRDIDISWAAPGFVSPELVRFRYRLEGLDEGWKEADTRRVAPYTHLPPGSYTFEVVAASADGVWGEQPASYAFVVHPALHQTPLFYVIVGASLLLLGGAASGLRVRQLRVRERELVEAVDERTVELRRMAEELEELSLRDPLTGLRNRRYLFETVGEQVQELDRLRTLARSGAEDRRSIPDQDALGVFLVDIDFFKDVNDTWGHDAGDEVLLRISQILEGCVRSGDMVVRWGGEEFLIILARTRSSHLADFAHRLRTRVAEASFLLPGGHRIHRTCSVGFACYPFYAEGPEAEDLSMEQVISAADLGLYRAKRLGRNRAVHVRAGPRVPTPEQRAQALSDLRWAEEESFLVAACTSAGADPVHPVTDRRDR